MKKIIIYILIALVALVLFLVAIQRFSNEPQPVTNVYTFNECVEAGFPIMESYPARCITKEGKSFVQEVGNELDYIDEIIVDNPRPTQKISSPLKVTGKARGSWYFEANFSMELFSGENDKEVKIGSAIATAEGEWMTTDFVPFSAEINYSTPTSSFGRLVIRNANPSGLEENEKVLYIPLTFEE